MRDAVRVLLIHVDFFPQKKHVHDARCAGGLKTLINKYVTSSFFPRPFFLDFFSQKQQVHDAQWAGGLKTLHT